VATYGRIDVLFNLAGRSHFGPIEDVTDDDWDAARREEVDLIFYQKHFRLHNLLL